MKNIFKILLIIKISILLGSLTLNGQSFTATGFQYHYRVGADNTLDKPIVILEGFDIDDSKSASSHYNDWSGFLDVLENHGYDVIALSYNDPYKSMHDNTQHLKDFIKEVNNKKAGNYEMTIIGQSMGGVIARMALAELEDESYDHQAGLYVSFDAPHRGANIPLGIQTFTENFFEVDLVEELSAYYIIFDIFIRLFTLGSVDLPEPHIVYMNALHSTAAQQMLIYHSKHSENDNKYEDLQSYLENLGYPQKSKNIALINGNNIGQELGVSEGENYYHKEWGNCNVGSYTFDIDISETNFEHDRVSLVRARTLFCKNITAKQGHGDFGSLFWDNAPGAYYDSEIKDQIGGSGVEKFCFMPTISSIDLNPSDYYVADYIGGMPLFKMFGLDGFNVDEGRDAQFLIENDHVPFDNIYSNGINTGHVNESWTLTQNRINDIIDQQIMWERKYLQNRTITRDRDFEAVTSITAGENVRSFQNQYNGKIGEFIVESGKTKFSAPEVILEGGFEVKPGAEFEIE